VESELQPGEGFKQLFHRANSAGQGHKAVGQLRHSLLSFVHGVHRDQGSDTRVSHLAFDEHARNYAYDLATRGQGGVGKQSHQAHIATTVDQAQPAGGQKFATPSRGGRVIPAGDRG